MSEPMEGPSTPSSDVRGPQDLVMRMNQATSEKWEQIPLPARQQLGYHERLQDAKSGHGINEYFGKSPQELVHGREMIGEGDNTERLSSIVGYHLEATEPPAEPAGAPGTAGYNQLNRGVPAADGYELDVEHTLTEAGGARVLQFAPDQGLSAEEQAKVDGAGPFIPSPVKAQATDDGTRYGTANGVLHGHPETWDAPGGTTEAAAAAEGEPEVSTSGDIAFAEPKSAEDATPPKAEDEQSPDETPAEASGSESTDDAPAKPARRGRKPAGSSD